MSKIALKKSPQNVYIQNAELLNLTNPTALPRLKLSSQFQHVVNYLKEPYHLSSETWASSVTFQSEVNFQCSRASLYLSFL